MSGTFLTLQIFFITNNYDHLIQNNLTMKKSIFILVLCVNAMISNLNAQIKVNSSGYVGINNTNPAYRLDVDGTFRLSCNYTSVLFDGYALYPNNGYPSIGTYGSYWEELYAYQAYFYYDPVIMSDLNLKTNISNLTAVKDKLRLLRPVSYNLKSDSLSQKGKTLNNLQYGFVAQELQEVFPDLIIKRDDGILGVRYTGLVPLLVQALKEQQDQIDALNKRISVLEMAVK